MLDLNLSDAHITLDLTSQEQYDELPSVVQATCIEMLEILRKLSNLCRTALVNKNRAEKQLADLQEEASEVLTRLVGSNQDFGDVAIVTANILKSILYKDAEEGEPATVDNLDLYFRTGTLAQATLQQYRQLTGQLN
jgi:hypothetical protein